MSQFKQLEQYKQLLDEGVITEEEFRKIKQKILGLKTDEEKNMEWQQGRAEALVEIEKMRAESEKVKAEGDWETSQAQQRQNYQNIYEEEKAKERARLEALEEQKQKEKEEQKEMLTKVAKTTSGVVKKVLLWIITFILLLMTIGSFGAFPGALGIITGLISLIIAVMACPLVTDKTRHIEKLNVYYAHKKVIVTLLVIIYFVAICVIPA